jgi:type IV pilus assembly protein PilM
MFRKTRSIVGLDIGSSAVKAVELTDNGEKLEVTGFGQIEVPTDDVNAKANAVAELMREGGFRTRRVVTSVSGKMVIVRYLTMVRMTDDELKNAIAFEAGKYVPFALEECVMDCQRIEGGAADRSGQGNMTVLFAAAKRSQVMEHLSLIQSAGVTPEIVDIDAFALSNAWSLTNPAPSTDGKPRSVAFIDVGAQKTSLNITIGDASLFTREIYYAGQDFTQAIARRMSLELPDAEQVKRNPGQNETHVRESVLSTIDDLGNEIQLSFDYFENQFEREIDEIKLSGGGSRLPVIRESFEKIFEKPTEDFNPFETLTVNPAIDSDLLACNASRLVVAVGLAARVRRS